ncbi:MAG: hypothetical protein JRN59_08495 [Nitrososphaerota archaeon]|nr:hypothetical protein [Nitrososphaerota archaeon]
MATVKVGEIAHGAVSRIAGGLRAERSRPVLMGGVAGGLPNRRWPCLFIGPWKMSGEEEERTLGALRDVREIWDKAA